MFRSIAAPLGAALLLAAPVAAAQSSKPPPVVAAGPAPAVPWCPPGEVKDATGKCAIQAPAATPAAKLPAATPVPAAKPTAPTYARPSAAGPVKVIAPAPAAKPISIAVGEPNGDCASQAPNLIHDSRSPGGCAPCPRGRVPNATRQACVIVIPRRY